MNSIVRLAAVIALLVLILPIAPSWGQSWNPTASDSGFNTAGGTFALENVVPQANSGLDNTAFGWAALANNTDGIGNTASGAQALVNTTTGNFNTASGAQALFSNISGSSDAAGGYHALYSNTTGAWNTANGVFALQNNITGSNNTAVGGKALKKSTGTKNIGIGYQAGVTLTTGSNNIFIGNQGAGDESQTIRIGTAQKSTFIAGIAAATVRGAAVEIDTITGQLGIAGLSSARYKQDIAPMGTSSEKMLELRPVTFAYKNDAQGTTHYGLIAEEVEKVYPELVTHTATGEVQAVRYQELIPMLLNELQRQRQEFQQALQGQERELAALRALVGQGRGTEAVIPSATVAVSGTGSVPQ